MLKYTQTKRADKLMINPQHIKDSETLRKLMQPLMDQFGFAFFSYMRIYPDNTVLVLTTNTKLIADVLDRDEFIIPAGIISQGIHLCATYLKPELIEKLQKTHNFYPGPMLIIDKEHYREQMSFHLKENDHNLINRYINNPSLLHKFKFAFNQKAHELIQSGDKNRIKAPSNIHNDNLLPEDQECLDMLKQIKLSQYIFSINGNEATLTQREMECFLLLLQLKPNKVIAKVLNITERTVTFHIQNIYKKFNCNSKSKLYEIAINNGFIGINKNFFSH